jgi:hypothetical protein
MTDAKLDRLLSKEPADLATPLPKQVAILEAELRQARALLRECQEMILVTNLIETVARGAALVARIETFLG